MKLSNKAETSTHTFADAVLLPFRYCNTGWRSLTCDVHGIGLEPDPNLQPVVPAIQFLIPKTVAITIKHIVNGQ